MNILRCRLIVRKNNNTTQYVMNKKNWCCSVFNIAPIYISQPIISETQNAGTKNKFSPNGREPNHYKSEMVELKPPHGQYIKRQLPVASC